MSKRMLISVDRDESRAAVIEDGQLIHLEIEPVGRNTCKGNIYRATIARVEPSLQSAFVDFGNEKQGFLPVGEIHPKLRTRNDDKKAPIQDLIKARQEVLVQVVRDEIGQKGATLSTFISLPGRYLVLIPESDKDKAGVSRKLSDEARDRIKKLTETMKVPDGFGLIVRTAGETATETELAKDLLYLTRQWEHITKKFEESKGPTLLYAERNLAVRFVRDYFTKDIEELVIDDDETLHEVTEFLSVLMPRSLAHVQRYAGDMPLFARYGIEGKVEDVFARQVFLSSGGSIVIDQTEAMVAIDVNSGRVKEKDIEETARATNIEAAEEIARQLMLRDMGGLVVIDFIDMREKKYVREVEQALKDAFKNDKARTKLGHISEFGLLELSRQRIKSSVNKGTFDACPHCSGTGRMRSFESVAMSVLRRIYEMVSQKRIKYVIATVPAQTARYLLNARRAELTGVEKQYHLTIEIIPVQDMPATHVMIEHLEEIPIEQGAERADRQKLLRVTQELDLVRNHLIKREETKMAIEAAILRRGAKVGYAEIYKEVREMAPTESDLAAAGSRGPKRGSGAGAGRAGGDGGRASVAPAQIVDVEVEEVAPPRGIGAWFKSLFGFGNQPRPVEAAAPAIAAALAAPAAVGKSGSAATDSRGEGSAPGDRSSADRPRPDRERRERRDGRRSEPRPDSRPELKPDRPAAGTESPDERAEPAADGRTDAKSEPRGERGSGRRERCEGRSSGRPARSTEPRADVPAVEVSEAALIAAKVASASAIEDDANGAEGVSADGRRRRRRRRRGGAGDRLEGGAGADGSAEDGAGPEDDGGSAEDGNRDDVRSEGSSEASVVTPRATLAAASDAQGADSNDESGSGPESIVADPKGPGPSQGLDAEERSADDEDQTARLDVDLPVPEALSGPVLAPSALAATAEPAPVQEESVDARSLMQEEIAKLLGEPTGASVAQTAEPVELVAQATELPAKNTVGKRFVIDLRTPK